MKPRAAGRYIGRWPRCHLQPRGAAAGQQQTRSTLQSEWRAETEVQQRAEAAESAQAQLAQAAESEDGPALAASVEALSGQLQQAMEAQEKAEAEAATGRAEALEVEVARL